MSTEQYNILMSVFDRKQPPTKEEAIEELAAIGVLNPDGTPTEEYSFLVKKSDTL